MKRARTRSISAVDVTASALSRLVPRALHPRLDQLRLDVGSVVDGFRGRHSAPYTDPHTPPLAPAVLSSIDPIEHLLPRGLRYDWVTLRTDVRWLRRDLGGLPRPFLVDRGPSRYVAQLPRPSLRPRRVRVTSITRETPDAVTVSLAAPDGAPLAFEAGQFLTFHLVVDGQLRKRAYSLSTSPLDGASAAITVKRIEGGRVSGWIHEHLEEGAVLDVLGPSGAFCMPADPTPARLVMIAGGSGITPVASIAETVLRSRPELSVSLVYGNRAEADVIFRARLAALAADHPERLSIEHALEAPPEGWTGPRGRLDAAVLGPWLDALPDDRPRLYYLCGPAAMMDAARTALRERGVPDARILEERFQSPKDPGDAAADLPTEAVTVHLKVKGRDHVTRVEPGQTLLEAGLASGAALPFSCTMGGCAACKGKLVEGAVAMDEPNCLTERERAEGWVLTCSARPLGAVRVEVE